VSCFKIDHFQIVSLTAMVWRLKPSNTDTRYLYLLASGEYFYTEILARGKKNKGAGLEILTSNT